MTPFLFFSIIAAILFGSFFLAAYLYSVRQRHKQEAHDAYLRQKKEELSPYAFYRTVQSADNQIFSFGHIQAGDRLRIRRDFVDHGGQTFHAGETYDFASAFFLPYEGVYTLFLSSDGKEITRMYLHIPYASIKISISDRRGELTHEELPAEEDICCHTEEYFELLLPRE